jgi:hypothetical protein
VGNDSPRRMKVHIDPPVASRKTITVDGDDSKNIEGINPVKRVIVEDIDKNETFMPFLVFERAKELKGRKAQFYVDDDRSKNHFAFTIDDEFGVLYIADTKTGRKEKSKFSKYLKERKTLKRLPLHLEKDVQKITAQEWKDIEEKIK